MRRKALTNVGCELLGLFGFRGSFHVWQQNGSESLFINCLGPHGRRMVHPNNHTNLDPSVKGNHRDQKTHKIFNDREERKDNPVCQPLCDILVSRVHRFEWHVRRVNESQQIDNQFSSSNHGQQNCEQGRSSKEKGGLRVSSLFFDFLQSLWKE